MVWAEIIIKKTSTGYQYIFYKLSRWDWYNWGNRNLAGASWTGLFALSFLLWAHFLNFLTLLEIITGYGFKDLFSKPEIIGITSVFLYVNYLVLFRNKKYLKIINQFEKEDKKSRIKGNIFTWLFVIGTLFINFFFLYLLKILRPNIM
jgi:hypothetical protein